MKGFNKIVAVTAAASMAFSCVVTAFAAPSNITVKASSDKINPGDTVTVTAQLDTLSGAKGLELHFEYDKSAFSVDTANNEDYNFGNALRPSYYPNYISNELTQLRHEQNHISILWDGFTYAANDDVTMVFYSSENYTITDDDMELGVSDVFGATFTANDGVNGKYDIKVRAIASTDSGDVNVEQTVSVQVGEDTPAPEPAVNSVTINEGDTATVNGGETKQLSVTVDAVNGADATVTWSIDPASPATISQEGLFTAPEATEEDQVFIVKATSNFNAEISDSIEITVPKKEAPQPQQPTTDITANNGTGGVYFDVTMNGNGESITGANVVVAGPTADGEGKEVTFNIINYGDVQGELSFILGILTEIAGEYTGTSNVTTGVGTATDSASVTFPAQ